MPVKPFRDEMSFFGLIEADGRRRKNPTERIRFSSTTAKLAHRRRGDRFP
jgi:hypothetical protein